MKLGPGSQGRWNAGTLDSTAACSAGIPRGPEPEEAAQDSVEGVLGERDAVSRSWSSDRVRERRGSTERVRPGFRRQLTRV